jgi:hypothetical protein
MQRATRFAVGRQRVRYSTQATALQTHQERVLRNAMCPSCGSSEYSQYPPGAAPPETPLAVAAPAAAPPVPAAAPPAPPPPLEDVSPARWAKDPYARHELRYWNGTEWTKHVSDRGATAVDPASR